MNNPSNRLSQAFRTHVFALTGGIGSGKSTVADIWARTGLPIIDADRVARKITEPGGIAIPKIVATFGDDILSQDGLLHRNKLACIVFNDVKKRNQLHAIMHPLIRDHVTQEIEGLSHQRVPLACYEAALILENHMDDEYKPVVVVVCAEATQRARAARRNNVSEESIQKRMDHQITNDLRIQKAHFVIDNDTSFENLSLRSLQVLKEIRSGHAMT